MQIYAAHIREASQQIRANPDSVPPPAWWPSKPVQTPPNACQVVTSNPTPDSQQVSPNWFSTEFQHSTCSPKIKIAQTNPSNRLLQPRFLRSFASTRDRI